LKIIFIVIAIILVVGVAFTLYPMRRALVKETQYTEPATEGSLWTLETETLAGEATTLLPWQNKVALVVNVASECGLTPQYEQLEALYGELKDQDFVVLAFPSNQFKGQEPGTAAEIREFCDTNYNITFPMFQKSVVAGDEKNNIYQFLTASGLEDPTWNFTKYLVNREGQVIARFAPRTAPDDPELKAAVVGALNP